MSEQTKYTNFEIKKKPSLNDSQSDFKEVMEKIRFRVYFYGLYILFCLVLSSLFLTKITNQFALTFALVFISILLLIMSLLASSLIILVELEKRTEIKLSDNIISDNIKGSENVKISEDIKVKVIREDKEIEEQKKKDLIKAHIKENLIEEQNILKFFISLVRYSFDKTWHYSLISREN